MHSVSIIEFDLGMIELHARNCSIVQCSTVVIIARTREPMYFHLFRIVKFETGFGGGAENCSKNGDQNCSGYEEERINKQQGNWRRELQGCCEGAAAD